MRLRGVYVLLATAASVGAMLVLAGPAAAANYPCGTTTFSASGTYHIYGNQDANGVCYTIAADNVTLIFSPGTSTITETSGNTDTYVIDDSGYCGTSNNEPCTGLTVENAQIVQKGTVASGSGSAQIYIQNSANNNVLDSTLTGGYNGLLLEGNTDTLVKGNTITSGAWGVSLIGETTDVLSGNTITGNGTTGVYLDSSAGIVISGNTISGNNVYGINSDSNSAGLAINGNILDGNSTGMHFDRNSGNQVANNYVQNSTGTNSPGFGIWDYRGDLNSYTGNMVNENYYTGFNIFAWGNGPVTLVNNASNTSQTGDGYRISEAYNYYAYGGPYTTVTGNIALGNTHDGFVDMGNDWRLFNDLYSPNETWTSNSSWYNGDAGFIFHYPTHYTINGNSGSYNGTDGFRFEDVSSPNAPASFANNAAMYNNDMGFFSYAPLAGSGNTGGGTNVNGDCSLVGGCN